MKNYNFCSIGTELEGFLVTEQQVAKNRRWVRRNIYNAQKIFANHFGSDISKLGYKNGVAVFPDGTALESTTEPCSLQAIENILFYIRNAKGSLEKVAQILKKKLLITSYLREVSEGNSVNIEEVNRFINPGNRFSSEKVLYNAYSNKCKLAVKKEDGDVSFRTAGFHIHFSFHDQVSQKIFEDIKESHDLREYPAKETFFYTTQVLPHINFNCSAIVKALDEIVDSLIAPHMSRDELMRESLYATRGDFRIKTDTLCGRPTLEYRRLSSEFINKSPELIRQFFNQVHQRLWSFVTAIKDS